VKHRLSRDLWQLVTVRGDEFLAADQQNKPRIPLFPPKRALALEKAVFASLTETNKPVKRHLRPLTRVAHDQQLIGLRSLGHSDERQ